MPKEYYFIEMQSVTQVSEDRNICLAQGRNYVWQHGENDTQMCSDVWDSKGSHNLRKKNTAEATYLSMWSLWPYLRYCCISVLLFIRVFSHIAFNAFFSILLHFKVGIAHEVFGGVLVSAGAAENGEVAVHA